MDTVGTTRENTWWLGVGILLTGWFVTMMSIAIAAPAYAAVCPVSPGIAHRGGNEHYVENTDNANRDATNVGVNQRETDIRFTSDDVPIIMHDPDVDRTTNGTGNVADLTAADIAVMRTADDQPIPTFRQYINDAQVDGAKLFIELKVNPTDDQWESFKDALTSRSIPTSRIIIMSFDKPTLTEAATELSTYQRGLVQGVGDVDPATVLPYATNLIKDHNAITWSRNEKWTDAGLKVYAWTVDDAGEWARMSYTSGVITDKPTAYLAWQKARVC